PIPSPKIDKYQLDSITVTGLMIGARDLDRIDRMESGESQCRMQPSVWFLVGTLLLTGVATAMLCGAIMTDHWEHVTWDRGKLKEIRNMTQAKQQWVLEWLLDGKVGRIVYAHSTRIEQDHDQVSVFLIPMHGGIWTLCVSLTDEERHLLLKVGFTQTQCINYLDPDINKGDEGKADWQHMENLKSK
ncbi:hypothetical protein L9F63_022973, partial [Diploptera punctata]